MIAQKEERKSEHLANKQNNNTFNSWADIYI